MGRENTRDRSAYSKAYYKRNETIITAHRKLYRENNRIKLKAYGKNYRKKNKARIKAYSKIYHKKNTAARAAYGKAYYKRNKAKYKVDRRAYYKANRKEKRANGKAYRLAQRLQVMEAYGKICQCCGEANLAFLTIDHINNDGAKHRRTLRAGGGSLCSWLIKHSFPSGYQVLCYNCNCGRSRTPDRRCPHKFS